VIDTLGLAAWKRSSSLARPHANKPLVLYRQSRSHVTQHRIFYHRVRMSSSSQHSEYRYENFNTSGNARVHVGNVFHLPRGKSVISAPFLSRLTIATRQINQKHHQTPSSRCLSGATQTTSIAARSCPRSMRSFRRLPLGSHSSD
jgi:hypothetical protein